MNKRTALLLAIVFVIAIGVFTFKAFAHKDDPASTEQNVGSSMQTSEQTNNEPEGDTPLQPDINTQEFKLAGSNVSCSTTAVNGVKSSSCSGNIQVVPTAQAGMDPGLYKINEQTKLLHGGQEQDLNTLQQLSQSQTIVRLKLSDGSNDMLAEIRY